MRLYFVLLAVLGGAGQTFDVVSVKPHRATADAPFAGMGSSLRPDGSLTMSRVSVALLLALAYQPMSTADMVGLPEWATREHFDIAATASLPSPTMADRLAMVRAMLADRFRLQVHRERRDVPFSLR